ncbi:MAG TPA: hypothetical protein PLF61_00060, partial [Candidatus Goldiibacteriota bacterium]|nr:hypothetical protein [Candidatus Goldiibacteriota bacterium]
NIGITTPAKFILLKLLLIYIIKTDLKPVKQAVLIKKELNEKFGIKFPMDIIVRTPEFVQKRQNEDFL